MLNHVSLYCTSSWNPHPPACLWVKGGTCCCQSVALSSLLLTHLQPSHIPNPLACSGEHVVYPMHSVHFQWHTITIHRYVLRIISSLIHYTMFTFTNTSFIPNCMLWGAYLILSVVWVQSISKYERSMLLSVHYTLFTVNDTSCTILSNNYFLVWCVNCSCAWTFSLFGRLIEALHQLAPDRMDKWTTWTASYQYILCGMYACRVSSAEHHQVQTQSYRSHICNKGTKTHKYTNKIIIHGS